jgi:RNA polymerase primary sigma factor
MWSQRYTDECEADASSGHYFSGEAIRPARRRTASRAGTGDGLAAYLKAVSRIPLLTRQEELELARRVKKGDVAAKEKMVRGNLRLVISIARRYKGMGLPLADLIGEGNLGLIKAVDRYRPEKGFRFSTYASKWIRQAITKTLATDSRTVRLPANVIEIIRKARAAEEDVLQSKRREPAEAEI